MRRARYYSPGLAISSTEFISGYSQRGITIQTSSITNECPSVSSGKVSLFSFVGCPGSLSPQRRGVEERN